MIRPPPKSTLFPPRHSSFFFLMIRRPPRSTLFPTRRSSDLQRTWPSIWIPDFLSAVAQSDAPLRHTERVRLRLHIPAEPPVPADQPSLLVPRRARADGRTADRKSTRLNSSHQIISYAVFCLK